jgi:hypothetical protein
MSLGAEKVSRERETLSQSKNLLFAGAKAGVGGNSHDDVRGRIPRVLRGCVTLQGVLRLHSQRE